MTKIFENKRIGNVRTVSILGFPLYVTENTVDYCVQKFLSGLIYTKRDKSKIKEIKIFKVFNITVSERILENDIIKYYCGNRLTNKIHLAELFYKKYLKKIKFQYDDVYVFDCNSGEICLFLAYLAKSFLQKNQSKMPLFIATKKYHVDILKLYLPEAGYIFIPDLKLKTQNSYWECCGHRFFILFSGDYFEKIEKDIKEQQIGDVHYLDCMLKALELTKKDFVSPDTVIPLNVKDTLSKKTDKLALNSDNFVILAPEALTCEEISKDFWIELAEELQNRDFDVYLNITNKKNYIKNCKSLNLSYSEVYWLATKARAVISLRSGLSEFLLPAEIPNIAIYTKFRHPSYTFPVDKAIAGFSMLKIPFVKKDKICELNFDEFQDEKELLNRVLLEFDSLVSSNNEKAGCSV